MMQEKTPAGMASMWNTASPSRNSRPELRLGNGPPEGRRELGFKLLPRRAQRLFAARRLYYAWVVGEVVNQHGSLKRGGRETSAPVNLVASTAVSVMKCVSPRSAWSILCKAQKERWLLSLVVRDLSPFGDSFPAQGGRRPHRREMQHVGTGTSSIWTYIVPVLVGLGKGMGIARRRQRPAISLPALLTRIE